VDVASQWLQDKAASPNQSHKANWRAMNSFVRRYYDNSLLFAFVTGGCEAVLLGTYVKQHMPLDAAHEVAERIFLGAFGPAVILKCMFSMMALWGAGFALAERHAGFLTEQKFRQPAKGSEADA
jgi:hypothetical protein